MSAWKRRALQLFPDWRRRVDAAASPLALWRELYRTAIDACAREPIDEDVLTRTFCYARDSRGGAEHVGVAVGTEFWERLFDDDPARPHFGRHLLETEFLELETKLASRFSPGDFARMRTEFYQVRAEADAGTTLGIVRELKDNLVRSGPVEVAKLATRAWIGVVPLLEVGEAVVGLEIFLDNLGESTIPIQSDIEQRLREVLRTLNGT